MMKFNRTKFDSLDGQTIIARVADDESFQLRAKKGGLELSGALAIEDETDLQAFAKLLSEAWVDRRSLKVKLATTLAG